MMQFLSLRGARFAGLGIILLGLSIIFWNVNSLHDFRWNVITSFITNSWDSQADSPEENVTESFYFSPDIQIISAQGSPLLEVNMTSLKYKVRNMPECTKVASDPKSYWRSQSLNGSLNTTQADIARMATAFKCGILDKDYLTTPPTDGMYAFEKFYLSDPPLADVYSATSENFSTVTLYNARLRVALAYPREYLRAVLHMHQVIKCFRPIAAIFTKGLVSEATPCYHTPVLPGFRPSELCNLTRINGSPWFCGHPMKSQLNCSDYVGIVAFAETNNYPVTDAEMEILNRSCREPRIRNITSNIELTVLPGNAGTKHQKPCNKVSPQTTWAQEIPTGYMFKKRWFPRFCSLTNPDTSECFKNKQILIFGDSNGRVHYDKMRISSKCMDIKKALTEKWHKPLLCVHKENNFSLRWDPHANPFLHGHELADVSTLIATSNAIDDIPSQGKYLIILNHYYHFTAYHTSSIDYLFRHIKNALVRLFNRNTNVQVVLQGPHIAWLGWPDHYAAGDMFGEFIMQLEREIFHDIKDKVVFISPWDLTIATANRDYHPTTNNNIYDIILSFMCGR